MPALTPADVQILSSRMKIASLSTAMDGCCSRSMSHMAQCVAARLLSSTPVFANRKAPLHTETVRCAFADNLVSHCTNEADSAVTSWICGEPGTIIVSISYRETRATGTVCTATPSAVCTNPPLRLTVSTR